MKYETLVFASTNATLPKEGVNEEGKEDVAKTTFDSLVGIRIDLYKCRHIYF